MNKSDNPWMEF